MKNLLNALLAGTTLFILFAGANVSTLVASATSPTPANVELVWEKIDETDGIQVYRSEIPGNPVLAFKGNGAVDAPIEKIASVIFDSKRAPEWVLNLEKSEVLGWVSEDEFIQYDHIGTPFVMKDRDFVSKVKITIDPVRRQMTFQYRSTEDARRPAGDPIRGNLIKTTFILTSIDHGNRTQIEGEIHCDPMGDVPKWIVNFFQKSWPVKTLQNLREQVAKPDLKIRPEFANLFSTGIPGIKAVYKASVE